MRGSLLVVVSLLAWSSRAVAQAAVTGPVPSVVFSTPAPGPLRIAGLIVPADSVERDIRPTYWKEGALVGGLVGATAGALLGAALCRNSEGTGRDCAGRTVSGALISGLVLTIPGALIGGQMHKDGAPE